MTGTRQIAIEDLHASLRPVASLRLDLDAFARAHGLSVQTERGNLGDEREVLLQARDGTQYMLVGFLEGPTREIELRASETNADSATALARFRDEYQLPTQAVVWQVEADAWAAHRRDQPDELSPGLRAPRSA